MTESTLSPDEQDKLRELTTQSWNLELAISGVAMFAILQLPDLLDSAFGYLQYNFITQTEGIAGMMPSLAYSMIRAGCNVLFAAFLANFVMRAFWVGLVGLLAVFPSGIHYDRIPFMTPYAQKRLADDLGPLDRYILSLDKRCNIVFAVAFQGVFFTIVIAGMYIAVLGVYLLVRPNVPDWGWLALKILLGTLVVVYYLAYIVVNLKQVKETPAGIKWHYRLVQTVRYITWGMYRPSSFITNTFYSHIPQKRFARTMLIAFTVFIVVFTAEYLSDQLRSNRRASLFNDRHLYSARVDSLYIDRSAYDNQRPEDAYINVAAIQADVIRDPYIRLFIAYPKALDTLLTRMASEPVWPDTLSRQERRRQRAIWSSQQLSQLIQISVNDSLYTRPTLLFTQAGLQEQRGWQTVLVPPNLLTGHNQIRVSVKRPGTQQPDVLTTIPFWYVPEK